MPCAPLHRPVLTVFLAFARGLFKEAVPTRVSLTKLDLTYPVLFKGISSGLYTRTFEPATVNRPGDCASYHSCFIDLAATR